MSIVPPVKGDCRTVKILLVDDEPALRELLRATFEGADVSVDEAEAGRRGAAPVRARSPAHARDRARAAHTAPAVVSRDRDLARERARVERRSHRGALAARAALCPRAARPRRPGADRPRAGPPVRLLAPRHRQDGHPRPDPPE